MSGCKKWGMQYLTEIYLKASSFDKIILGHNKTKYLDRVN